MFVPTVAPIASHADRRSGRSLMRRFAVVLVFLLLGSASARCEEAVLLTATAPGFAPGMVIATTQHLTVPQGASVTLLFRSGQMLHLKGPFDGSLQQAESAQADRPPSVLAQVLRLRGVDASVIGATRATSAIRPQAVQHDVLVDPRRSATYCVQPADSVWIAVAEQAGPSGGDYRLRHRGSERTVAWSAGEARIPWPDDIPIEDGDRFEIADAGATAVIRFHTIRASVDSDGALVAAGLLHGCAAQFDGRLDRLIQDSVPPELWLGRARRGAAQERHDAAIHLTAQSSVDGYLYCLAQAPDGAVAPMPVNGVHLRAALPVALTPPHGLRPGEAGLTEIRCWLSRQELAGKLPIADPDRFSDRIGGAPLAQASLEIRGASGTSHGAASAAEHQR